MAQQTSNLWKKLWRLKDTSIEYAFDISSIRYGSESEVSHSVESSLYDEFSIGNATTAKLTLSLYADNILFGAVIKRYARLVNGEQASEWIPKGIFFTNRRSVENIPLGILRLHAKSGNHMDTRFIRVFSYVNERCSDPVCRFYGCTDRPKN